MITDHEGKIKVRGNSTATLTKKPYNIKFSEKKDAFSMGRSKKWCLLANFLDPTLMRNKLSYDFAERIGVPYTCKNEYVELYLNNEYQGSYLMTIPVQAGSSSVDINVKDVDSDANENSYKNGDYLLEIETRIEDDVVSFDTSLMHLNFNEPEEPVPGQVEEVKQFLSKVETALQTGTYEDISKLIDVDSFVNFYITQELFKNIDVATSSTRFFIKQGILYAGPLWDMDLSCGNCSTINGYPDYELYNNINSGDNSGHSYVGRWALVTGQQQDPTRSWIGLLMQREEFRNAFCQRYLDLQPEITNLYQDSETLGTNQMDQLTNQYAGTFAREQVMWPVDRYREDELYEQLPLGTTYIECCEELREWLRLRNQWLLKDLGIDEIQQNGGKIPVTVALVAMEGGSVQGGGTYHYGDEVTLRADALQGYSFVGWKQNGTIVSDKKNYAITKLQMDISLTAVFEKKNEQVPPITGQDTKNDVVSDYTTKMETGKQENNPTENSSVAKPEATLVAKPIVTPGKPSISKVSSSKKTIVMTWKKKKGVKGYQLRYCLKSAKKYKTVTTTKTKLTIRKLIKGKRYSLQLRTYNLDANGHKVYSKWSNKKTVKVK